jgi:hypothetical protein
VTEVLWALFAGILRGLKLVLDIMQAIENAQFLTQAIVGRNEPVKPPAPSRPLPPAAQRALSEAEERRQRREQNAQRPGETS